jgi:hypothetical protein
MSASHEVGWSSIYTRIAIAQIMRQYILESVRFAAWRT